MRKYHIDIGGEMAIDWEDHGFFSGQTIIGMSEMASSLADWENPALAGRGRLAPHAPLLPREELYRAPFVQMLNGIWRFHLAATPHEVPEGFQQPEFDDRAWSSITVPGHWELQGFGQPRYTNIQYPFPADPPHVPADENPTGCYRTAFTLPQEWAGREIILVFEGVDSAFHLWVDGCFVGFSKGSRNPAEFRITPFLSPGRHILAVSVYRWSDGSYIEDQDMWYLSGIFRDVYLQATPSVSIRDVGIRTQVDLVSGSAQVQVAVELQSFSDALKSAHDLRAEIYDADGAVIASDDVSIMLDSRAHFYLAVPQAQLWSPENPYQYHLWLRLDENQETHHLVGIRKVEISNGQLWVNGRSVKLRGIIELCLDHCHAGTGNTTLRAERLHRYQIPAEEITWRWLLQAGEIAVGVAL